jgi:transposase
MPPRYTDDFKMEAAKQVTIGGHAVRDVASRLGVHPDSLKVWVRIYNHPIEHKQSQSTNEQLRQLKAELKRITEERDILKKAAAYFAKNQG